MFRNLPEADVIDEESRQNEKRKIEKFLSSSLKDRQTKHVLFGQEK